MRIVYNLPIDIDTEKLMDPSVGRSAYGAIMEAEMLHTTSMFSPMRTIACELGRTTTREKSSL